MTNFASTEVMSGKTNLSGSIAGAVTVDAGAQLSPGASGVGALTVGDTTLSAGSGLVIDLDPANGQNDVLNVNGAVVLTGADLVLDLLSAPTRGESFDILTNDGTDPIFGQFSEGYSGDRHVRRPGLQLPHRLRLQRRRRRSSATTSV